MQRSFPIIQHKCLLSWHLVLSLFISSASAKISHSVVCLRDSPFWLSCLPSFPNFIAFAPPARHGLKLKVAIYVSSNMLAQATIHL